GRPPEGQGNRHHSFSSELHEQQQLLRAPRAAAAPRQRHRRDAQSRALRRHGVDLRGGRQGVDLHSRRQGAGGGSDPLVAVAVAVAETSEEPNAAARPLDPNLVGQRLELDLNLVGQRLIERLAKEQAAVNRRWEQQYNSLRAEEAMYRTEQEKLSQVKVVVKVKPKQDELGINWSQIKNKIFRREGREICSEHVNHQTHPITEVRRHHRLDSDEANHLDAYSESRSVIGDGECFYRSFIFSYLVIVLPSFPYHRM
uniref:OTU domain-containing protein n=2 Tax=Aegilops tauschii subsp. strangulata TaxID=200361 RepID=A0A453MZ00_AEGTS